MRCWLIGILLLASCMTARAHDLPPPDNISGYNISAIDHASMQVIAPFRSRILNLARSVSGPSPHLAALLLHNQQQAANCLWEILPGSLSDEESPLNRCAHADMAGLKAILDELLELEGTRASATILRSDIDYQMVLLGTSFVKCAYSATPFNTASQIRPDWLEVLTYFAAGYGLVAGLVLALMLLITFLLRWRSFGFPRAVS